MDHGESPQFALHSRIIAVEDRIHAMRSILVQADRSPSGRSRLETALSLARMTGGHVTALVDTPVARYTTVDGMGAASVAADALREALDDDDAYAQEVNARVAREDVPCDVLRAETEPLEALARAGRLADVVIVSRSDQVAGDLPLSARAPVLALNDVQTLMFPLSSVCLAWDGSAEAAYALRCAMPLLAGCGDVTVLTVEDLPADWPATDALSYLSRHGISAELKVLPRKGSIEETLADEFGTHHPALVVMGAFGHSRLREFLFGGVTRTFLELEEGPALLLAH